MLTQILARTPIWVFALFVGLVYLGYIQSKTRRLSGARLAVVPIALGAFSVFGVYSAFGTHVVGIVSWGFGIALAFLLNVFLKQPRGLSYISTERVYVVPGSWIPFALMMTMFFTRYVVTVLLTKNPALADETIFTAAVCLFYGLLSGTFFARAWYSRSGRANSVMN